MLLRGRARRVATLLLLSLTSLGILFSFHSPSISRGQRLYEATSPLSDVDSATLCKKQHLTLSPDRDQRKVYDLFTLNTELDILEIRLHTLAPHVDYFIIAESTHTFTGQLKPLHFHSNLTASPRFAPFTSQIIHHTFHPDLSSATIDPWSIERAQRNSLLTALQSLPPSHPAHANENDILLVSDIDELPRPSALHLLRTCTFPTPRITLSTTPHLYSFNFIHSLAAKRHWPHPQATVYRSPPNLTIWPEDLRTSAANPRFKSQYRVIGNAGWHCSTCFSTIAEIQAKIRGFSHQEFNHPLFLDPAQIVRRVKHGVDVAERRYERFIRVSGHAGAVEHQHQHQHQNQNSNQNQQKAALDMPEYVRLHKDQFPWLFDRDAPNARLADWKSPEGQHEGEATSLDDWQGPWPEVWPE